MENKLQPLNYCRQLKKTLSNLAQPIIDPRLDKKEVDMIKFMTSTIYQKDAVKFMLPKNGVLIEDEQLKGLADVEEIRLPYPKTILEYETDFLDDEFTKTILICREDLKKGRIAILQWMYSKKYNEWAGAPIASIYTKQSLNRNDGSDIKYLISAFSEDEANGYHYSSVALHNLLNALACSNVKIEKLERRKPLKGKKMDALPFDDYHVLTVATPSAKASVSNQTESIGDRHSPREHLRRGHIRRLQDGKKIWVNAAIINAGVGAKIHKNYAVN